jgi:glycosyltransferase involved in cell wall biosynthesis
LISKTLKYSGVRAKVFFVQDVKRGLKFFAKKSNLDKKPLNFINNIDHFNSSQKKNNRALITLPPWAWYDAIEQAPHIKYFNFTGLLYEMVKALNQNAFMVDIVDMNARDFKLMHRYDLVIGHGGGCKSVIEQIPSEAGVLQYVSGAYYEAFVKETEKRYERFRKRNCILQKIEIKRKLDSVEGEKYLTERADYLFSCFAPRMVEAFGVFKSKFFFTGLGAYLDADFKIQADKKDYTKGRNNFIYVGGTNGNIQKGLDIIIEAFANTPSAHLFIYCEIEPEILKNYKKELSLPNIHYIYHYRFLKKSLSQLLSKINFTVHAPINTGLGTAFTGSMGSGLIPVGYIDIPSNPSWNILTDIVSVEALEECIQIAQKKDLEWCVYASHKAIEYFNEHFSVENFANNFDTLVKKVCREKLLN